MTIFSASRRLGTRSVSCIEPDTSSAMTMSIPSRSRSPMAREVWGRASVTASSTTANRRRITGRSRSRETTPRPAHEIALERLDRLGSYGFLENADNRPFYFAVSEIIRDYLGGRFGFDSLELTTDELLAELQRRAGPELVLAEIGRWLQACDLVKFAKISPPAQEARGTLEVAIRIVESTRPRPEPQAAKLSQPQVSNG